MLGDHCTTATSCTQSSLDRDRSKDNRIHYPIHLCLKENWNKLQLILSILEGVSFKTCIEQKSFISFEMYIVSYEYELSKIFLSIHLHIHWGSHGGNCHLPDLNFGWVTLDKVEWCQPLLKLLLFIDICWCSKSNKVPLKFSIGQFSNTAFLYIHTWHISINDSTSRDMPWMLSTQLLLEVYLFQSIAIGKFNEFENPIQLSIVPPQTIMSSQILTFWMLLILHFSLETWLKPSWDCCHVQRMEMKIAFSRENH